MLLSVFSVLVMVIYVMWICRWNVEILVLIHLFIIDILAFSRIKLEQKLYFCSVDLIVTYVSRHSITVVSYEYDYYFIELHWSKYQCCFVHLWELCVTVVFIIHFDNCSNLNSPYFPYNSAVAFYYLYVYVCLCLCLCATC